VFLCALEKCLWPEVQADQLQAWELLMLKIAYHWHKGYRLEHDRVYWADSPALTPEPQKSTLTVQTNYGTASRESSRSRFTVVAVSEEQFAREQAKALTREEAERKNEMTSPATNDKSRSISVISSSTDFLPLQEHDRIQKDASAKDVSLHQTEITSPATHNKSLITIDSSPTDFSPLQEHATIQNRASASAVSLHQKMASQATDNKSPKSITSTPADLSRSQEHDKIQLDAPSFHSDKSPTSVPPPQSSPAPRVISRFTVRPVSEEQLVRERAAQEQLARVRTVEELLARERARAEAMVSSATPPSSPTQAEKKISSATDYEY
jgi:hypothetical protein